MPDTSKSTKKKKSPSHGREELWTARTSVSSQHNDDITALKQEIDLSAVDNFAESLNSISKNKNKICKAAATQDEIANSFNETTSENEVSIVSNRPEETASSNKEKKAKKRVKEVEHASVQQFSPALESPLARGESSLEVIDRTSKKLKKKTETGDEIKPELLSDSEMSKRERKREKKHLKKLSLARNYSNSDGDINSDQETLRNSELLSDSEVSKSERKREKKRLKKLSLVQNHSPSNGDLNPSASSFLEETQRELELLSDSEMAKNGSNKEKKSLKKLSLIQNKSASKSDLNPEISCLEETRKESELLSNSEMSKIERKKEKKRLKKLSLVHNDSASDGDLYPDTLCLEETRRKSEDKKNLEEKEHHLVEDKTATPPTESETTLESFSPKNTDRDMSTSEHKTKKKKHQNSLPPEDETLLQDSDSSKVIQVANQNSKSQPVSSEDEVYKVASRKRKLYPLNVSIFDETARPSTPEAKRRKKTSSCLEKHFQEKFDDQTNSIKVRISITDRHTVGI